MFEPGGKLPIVEHLQMLYCTCRWFGLINFSFNPSKNTFEASKRLSAFSSAVYTVVACIYGSLTCCVTLIVLLSYTNKLNLTFEVNAIKTQKNLLHDAENYCHFVVGLLLGVHFKRLRAVVLPTANRIHSILQDTESQTGAVIHMEYSFKKFILFKICLTGFVTACKLLYAICMTVVCALTIAKVSSPPRIMSLLCLMFSSILFFYVNFTAVLVHLSHVFLHLTLMCVFSKLSEVLTVYSVDARRRQVRKFIRKSVAISLQVHGIKRNLDNFLTISYSISFLRAFGQFQSLYEVLKDLFYEKGSDTTNKDFKPFITNLPTLVISWYDIYLICRLSDMLVERHRRFQKLVFDILVTQNLLSRKYFQRKMDLELLQTHIQGLDTLSSGLNRIDQRVAFDFLMKLTVVCLVISLQFQAGKELFGPINSMKINETELLK